MVFCVLQPGWHDNNKIIKPVDMIIGTERQRYILELIRHASSSETTLSLIRFFSKYVVEMP